MRRARPEPTDRIRSWFYGFKAILTLIIGNGFPPVLEIRVEFGGVSVPWVIILSSGAGLPDFNQCPGNGPAFFILNYSFNKDDVSPGLFRFVLQKGEIIIVVQRICHRDSGFRISVTSKLPSATELFRKLLRDGLNPLFIVRASIYLNFKQILFRADHSFRPHFFVKFLGLE